MNVAGFSEALESAVRVRIDFDLAIPLASLPGLIILKLFAWLDRKQERRDAPDILTIISEYADAGNEERLYTDELQILEAAEFDITTAGARLLGEDARRVSSAQIAATLIKVLDNVSRKQDLLNQRVQSRSRLDEPFANRCALLLENFHVGFHKGKPQS